VEIGLTIRLSTAIRSLLITLHTRSHWRQSSGIIIGRILIGSDHIGGEMSRLLRSELLDISIMATSIITIIVVVPSWFTSRCIMSSAILTIAIMSPAILAILIPIRP